MSDHEGEKINSESRAESNNDNSGSGSSNNKESNEKTGKNGKQVGSESVEKNSWVLAGSYLIGWLVILVIFKLAYNRYQRQKLVNKKKWFPEHPEKEAYEALVAGGEENEEVLRKALLRRAMTDVKRVWQLQEEKESLHKLTRSGAIPESMWNSYKDADHDMQLEIYDLQAEAETFKPGWSQSILKEAAQLVQRERELTNLHRQLTIEAQTRISDPKIPDKERKAKEQEVMKEVSKARKMAESMINKKYGVSPSDEKDTIEDASLNNSNESLPISEEKGQK